MKVGILFSGQGSQYPGMGEDLYNSYEAARTVFDEAGAEIKDWCFNGTKEELRQTHITQPSVYTVTMAAYAAFMSELKKLKEKTGKNIEIGAYAGFSMGEYAALTVSGCVPDFKTGLSIIKKRGEYMTEAGSDSDGESKGSMIAVFGERNRIIEVVNEIKGNDILEAVNFNSPVQTVVAGDKDAVARLRKKVKEVDGLKGVPLSVSTAFHSTMMAPASDNLYAFLEGTDFKAPSVPVYSNMTGDDVMKEKPADMENGQWLRDRMAKQVMNPVYWQETVENMEKQGMDIMIEIGPGQVLTGLVKKTCPEVLALNVQDHESLKATILALENAVTG